MFTCVSHVALKIINFLLGLHSSHDNLSIWQALLIVSSITLFAHHWGRLPLSLLFCLLLFEKIWDVCLDYRSLGFFGFGLFFLSGFIFHELIDWLVTFELFGFFFVFNFFIFLLNLIIVLHSKPGVLLSFWVFGEVLWIDELILIWGIMDKILVWTLIAFLFF